MIVLWMVALLTIIAGNFTFGTRTHLQLTQNLLTLARVEALADAGVHRALYELRRPLGDGMQWKADGRVHTWNYQGAVIRMTAVDETAKIDINQAPEQLLISLFRYLGLAEEDATALSDAIQDWRDVDDLKHLHGAEAAEYAAAGLDVRPANGPFTSVEELRQVMGMNDALFRRVAPLITVFSQQPGVNPAVASREVLLALPGAQPAQIDTFLEAREVALAQGMPAPPFPLGIGISTEPSSAYTLRALARLPDNTAFLREAVVRISDMPAQPGQNGVAILAWRSPELTSAPNRN